MATIGNQQGYTKQPKPCGCREGAVGLMIGGALYGLGRRSGRLQQVQTLTHIGVLAGLVVGGLSLGKWFGIHANANAPATVPDAADAPISHSR